MPDPMQIIDGKPDGDGIDGWGDVIITPGGSCHIEGWEG
jgi:hypothetical protein